MSDHYCGDCGFDFTAVPSAGFEKTLFMGAAAKVEAEKPAVSSPFARTMLGVSASDLYAGGAQAAADLSGARASAALSLPSAKKTMLGVMPASPASPAAAQPAAAQPAPTPPGKLLTKADPLASTAEPDLATKATMVGSLSELAKGLPQAAPPAGKSGLAIEPTKRTMLGVVPMPSGTPSSAPPAPLAEPTQPGQDPVAAELPAAAFMAAPVGAAADLGAPSSTLDRRVPLSFSRPQGGPRESRPSAEATGTKQRSAWPVAWVAVALALLGVALGAVLLARTTELHVRVVEVAEREWLEIEAPGSAPGTRARFAGVEQALEAGRGRFALEPSALKVGDNPLIVDLVAPDGDLHTSTVSLYVPFRVHSDIAALSADPPAVEVIFDVVPGGSVFLEGEPLSLDAHGHGVRRFVVPPQEGEGYEVAYRYRVEANKTVTDSSIKLALPVTSLRIDRPGTEAVTDQPTLEIAGAVEPTAIVQLASQLLPVSEGRFLYRAPLPVEGEYTFELTAKAPGKAPRRTTLRARRVTDMALAAASFVADPQLSYARLAQNPSIYVGQKVAFDGRVYNVDVQGGRSVIQLLVRDCPGTGRCPLWVEYSQATDATVDTWVRVLGTVAGEQQFRSQQGQLEVVPSVHAQYVLHLVR